MYYFPCLQIVSSSMAARLQVATLAEELVGDVFCAQTFDSMDKVDIGTEDVCLDQLQAEVLTLEGINQQILITSMLVKCRTMGSFRGKAEADARSAFAFIAAELS